MFWVFLSLFLFLMQKGFAKAKGLRAHRSHSAALSFTKVSSVMVKKVFFNSHFTNKETETRAD